MAQLPTIIDRVFRRDPAAFERDRKRVERGFWPKIRRNLGRLSFLEDAVTAYYCAIDPMTPFKVKAALMGALAYFVLPSTMLPRLLRLTRLMDSGVMLTAAVRDFSRHIRPEHRLRAQAALARLREEEEVER